MFYSLLELNELFQTIFNDESFVFMHSGIERMGILKDEKNISHYPKRILSTLLKQTEYKNLYMPVYNYTFPSTRFSNLLEQKSEIGILTEEFRQNEKVKQTNHPIFSVAGFENTNKQLIHEERIETFPFGNNSFFHQFYENDGLFVFMGINPKVFTFTVYCEYMLNTHYRFKKPFAGKLISRKGIEFDDIFYHYCFPLDGSAKHLYTQMLADAEKEGIIRKFKIGASAIYTVKAKKYFSFLQVKIKKNPWYLLRNPPKYFTNYIDGKEVKIDIY